MSESWDEYAEGWDKNLDVILYAQKAYDTLCEVVDPQGLNVLDFGCGTGLLTERLATKADSILGLDSSEKMIAVLTNKHLKNVDVLVAELNEETVLSNALLQSKFDLIVASSVCAFLPDYENTLLLLKKLLKPQGVFVQWDWLRTGEDSDFGFTKNMIESAFNNAGLEISAINKAFSLENKEGVMTVLMGVARNV